MSMGLPTIIAVGVGTVTASSTGVTTLAVTPSSSTQVGDLIVAVAWGVADFRTAYDLGNGWMILAVAYDANPVSLLIAACISSRAGSSGHAGIGIKTAYPYRLQNHAYRMPHGGKFLLGAASRAEGQFYDASSNTNLDAPLMDNQSYQQGLDIIGRGFSTGGNTTSVAAITGFTERFDTGSATAPTYHVVLNDAVVNGAVLRPSVTSAIAAAKTGRTGVRAFIPVVGNTYYPGRMQGPRRLIG